MSDYPGANSNSTIGANLKEVYPKDKPKKKKFEKLERLLGK